MCVVWAGVYKQSLFYSHTFPFYSMHSRAYTKCTQNNNEMKIMQKCFCSNELYDKPFCACVWVSVCVYIISIQSPQAYFQYFPVLYLKIGLRAFIKVCLLLLEYASSPNKLRVNTCKLYIQEYVLASPIQIVYAGRDRHVSLYCSISL